MSDELPPRPPMGPPAGPPPPPSGPPSGPSYGGPPGQPYNQVPPPATTKSIVALILGITNFLLCSGLLAPAPIIVGHMALREIDASNGRLGGRGLALAGVILGYVGLGLIVLVIIALVGLAGLSGIAATSY